MTPASRTTAARPGTYRDTNGSSDGFAAPGALTVAAAALTVGWCNLQSPASTTALAGTATETIYGRFYVADCTGGGACTQLKGQVGLGGAGVDPQASPSSFLWTDAAVNPGHTGDANDEYAATLTPAAPGAYAYAYRVSVDDGATWSDCDRDGSTNGLELDQLGALTVTGHASAWCNVQFPTSLSVPPSTSTDPIYGQVLVTGCTEGAAQCADLEAQLGFGALDADPATWTWVDATYNSGHTSDDNDEYGAALTAAAKGSYGYVFRFSGDGGASWSYCDPTGSPFAIADVDQLMVQ